ncbi:MAG: rhomboid family intramembrane serine protease [Candidatus Bathyarchaeia archaeon]
MFEDRKRIRRPRITYLLLLSLTFITALLFVIGEPFMDRIFQSFSLVPARVLRGRELHTLVTYMFLHSGFEHFALNALALLGAGIAVERDIGSESFILLFLLSGIVAGLVHCFAFPNSPTPVVGASGAIFGVIAVLCLLMPFKITFVAIFPLPAVVVGIILGLAEAYSALYSLDPNIAHFAHLGGFAFGGLSAFIIDAERATRGLVIAVLVYISLYLLGRWLLLL